MIEFQPLSDSVYNKKYQLLDKYGNAIDQDRLDTFIRVAKALAKNEKDSVYWTDQFYSAMLNGAIPAGRILSNAGAEKYKPNTSLINCTLSRIVEDSITGIGEAVKEAMVTLSSGAGIGYEFSTLRPRGAFVNGVGSSTSGPLPFADIFDKACFTIASAGGRRGAQMATFDIRHPDVVDFIKIKREDGRFRQFNISVLVSDEFMDFNNKSWDFRFPGRRNDPNFEICSDEKNSIFDYWHVEDCNYIYNDDGLTLFKKYDQIEKKDLWDLMLKATYDYAEPGVIFVDRVNRENNLYFCEELRSTNPCITGDTLIAVAGRGPVPIATLVEENVAVPVYCYNFETKRTEVSFGRYARKTGVNKKVYKVTLDDGTSFKATENHNLYLRNGEKVQVKDLIPGSSLIPFKAKILDNGNLSVKSTDEYSLEYHLMLNCKYGKKLDFGRGLGKYHGHHIDGNHYNNEMSNLEALLHEEHSSLHLTENNPMKTWWGTLSEECKEEHRNKMSAASSGPNNGMFGKKHTEQTKKLIGNKAIDRFKDQAFKEKHSLAVSRTMTVERRALLAKAKLKEREIVTGVCSWCGTNFSYEKIIGSSHSRVFCSIQCTAGNASATAALVDISDETRKKIGESSRRFANTVVGKKAKSSAGMESVKQRALKCGNYLLSQGYEIAKNTWSSLISYLHKAGIKPAVSEEFITKQWNDNWTQFKNDCMDYNHKVASVEFVGYEDVYNIKVDKHHNYFIVTDIQDDGYTGINSANCSEVPLPPFGSCLLGSIDLTKFVSNPFTEEASFNFGQFKTVVAVFTRMLDNVVEMSGLPLQEQRNELWHKRRHGMGIMGLGTVLTMLRLKYGSCESFDFANQVMKDLAIVGYQTGLELAKEKGAAPVMDVHYQVTKQMTRFHPELESYVGKVLRGKELFVKSHYMQRLFSTGELNENDFLKYGCRFSHHTAIAPTGTISLAMCNNVSGGLEPSFSHQYFRNLTVEGKKTRQQESVYSYEFLAYKKHLKDYNFNGKDFTDEQLLKRLPDYFVTADSLSWKDHVNMLALLQGWTDQGCSKCVGKGTLVPTNYGILPIEELTDQVHKHHDSFVAPLKDLRVLCPDGQMRLVTDHYYGGKKPAKKIRFNNGYELVGSLVHKVMTPFGWKIFDDLRVGDAVLCSSDTSEYSLLGGVSLPQLEFTAHWNKIIQAPSCNSEDFSLFVGMWLADGSLNETSGTVSFCNSTDNVIDRYFELVIELFGVTPNIIPDKRSSINLRSVCFSSKPFCQWLKSLCGKGAENKKIPDAIMQGSKNEMLSLLRGVTLDGYKLGENKARTCVYEGKSQLLAKQLFEVCFVLGLEPRFSRKWVKSHNYFMYGVIVYNFEGCFEERKNSCGIHDRIVAIPQEAYELSFDNQHPQRATLGRIQRGEKTSGTLKEKSLINLGIAYDPTKYAVFVTDIEDCIEELYDITVESSHDYLIGGIWSHNTINVPTNISFEEFKDVYQYAYDQGCKSVATYRYNPETLGAILSRNEDLENTKYQFTLQDGTVVECKGIDKIEYDGEVTTAENLYNALKEKSYNKF